MDFTGERFVPGFCDELLEAEHRERYVFAAEHATGKKVLDIACGSGYGSRILADRGAAEVTGVDLSAEAVSHAKEKYGRSGVTFLTADAENYTSGCYDLVVSFETLEHLDKRDQFLHNLHTMIKTDGLLIISTPNKAITSPLREGNKIRNHYHKYEYLENEFVTALEKAGFRVTGRFGQHTYSSIFKFQLFSRLFRRFKKITPESACVTRYSGSTVRYFVFIASRK